MTIGDSTSYMHSDPEEDKDFQKDRIRFLYISGSIGIASSAIMTFIELHRNEFFRVIPAILFSIIAPFLLFSLYRNRKSYRKVLTGFAGLILFQQILGAFMSFNEVLMLIWYPVFPLTYFFLLGYQKALLWNATAIIGIIAGYLSFPFLNHIPPVSFPIFLSALFAYFVAVILAWYHYRVIHTYQNRLKKEALVDSLTGAVVRKAGLGHLSTLMTQNDRIPDMELFVVLMDIDNFKAINDQDGHQAGDQVLVQVAASIHRSIGQSDSFIRLGGEEFLLLIPGQSFDAAYSLTEKIRKQIEEEVKRSDGSGVTVSIGLTQYRSGESLSSLLHRADNLMYSAKKMGKNRICSQHPKKGGSFSADSSPFPQPETC
ncbi:MAG: GGDEF domain-containing protein [Leptospirillum sp.]